MSQERIDLAPKQKLPKNKKLTIVGVVVVVIVVAGMGFWTWHNSPSFCSAFCHTPMNNYVETYDQQAGAPGTDKWGNDVSNSSAMLVVSHKEAGQNCLSCHEPIISQQIGEVQATLTGDYYYPLEEANLEVLMQNSGNDAGVLPEERLPREQRGPGADESRSDRDDQRHGAQPTFLAS